MTFPILGGNGAVAGYQIDNSLRFNNDDSARLTNTAGTPTSTSTGTFSFWIKKTVNNNAGQKIYSTLISATPSQSFQIAFSGANADGLQMDMGNDVILETSALYRDNSAFYHFVIAIDQSQGTASNKIKVYVNGVQQTSFAVDNRSTYGSTSDLGLSINGQKRVIGSHMNETQNFLDGYLTEFYFIDGQQLDASSFGEFDEDSGIWKPKQFSGSYGTNGFYLDFENSGSLGTDQSGNGNNFTPTNLASTDQTTDTPTNNFATWNPLDKDLSVSPTLSEGNTKLSQPASGTSSNSNFGVPSGKWYFECKMTTLNNPWLGIVPQNLHSAGSNLFTASNTAGIYASNPTLYLNGSSQGSLGGGLSSGDIVMIAFDIDNGNFYVGKNGLWNDGLGGGFDQADFSNATAHTFTVKTGDNYVVGTVNGSGGSGYVLDINFGNPSFSISSGNSDGNGYGNFEYAPPSGYLALCTQNLATALSPTIDDGSQYFNTLLRNGTGASVTSITGVGFQPDFIWQKRRSSASSHHLTDSSRGATKLLYSELTNAEDTNANFVQSIDSDGFTMGSADWGTGDTVVAWNWKAGGGSVSNSDGSISSQVNVNQTAGFSIVTYTGTGSAGTVGHGLGKTPKMIIVKNRDGAYQWLTYHAGMTNAETSYIELNSTVAQQSGETHWNSTAPTSSVFSCLTQLSINNSGDNYLAYCFAEIEGYSKFGSYTGNGSTDGTFVYLGFRPAWIMVKRTDSANNWNIVDAKRDTINVMSKYVNANSSDAEASYTFWDFTSNGFKIRNTGSSFNTGNIIYMAFAENPFVTSSGVPVVAR